MRLLLDNCVPYRAKRLFAAHEVLHASDVGLERVANGELMARAAKVFDVFVATDKKIRHEHNLDALPIALLELNAHLTRFMTSKCFRRISKPRCSTRRPTVSSASRPMDAASG